MEVTPVPEQHSPRQHCPEPTSHDDDAREPLSGEQSSRGRTAAAASEPIDPDIDLRRAGPVPRGREDLPVLAVIAAGGAAGAAARYLIGATWPTTAGGLPVSTLTVNVAGCALIGVLMVLITDVWRRQRLLRPFLGTGVLGGFTTFSTYTIDIQRLVAAAHPGPALLYLVLTPVSALLAVWITATATRRLVNRRFP
jgi:fluoride exporter